MNESPEPKHDAVFIDAQEAQANDSYQQHFRRTVKHGFAVNQRKTTPIKNNNIDEEEVKKTTLKVMPPRAGA